MSYPDELLPPDAKENSDTDADNDSTQRDRYSGEEFAPPLDLPVERRDFRDSKQKGRSHPSNDHRFQYSQEEIRSLRDALQKSGVVRLAFYFLDYILRAQVALFEQIYSKQQLPRTIAAMSILCALLSSLYGLTMGFYNSPLQAISSAIKLPILFLLTALICIPSLYTFNVLLGQRFRFMQTVALMVTTLATTTILLVSLAPIAFFFTLTTPENYQFLLLLHVIIFSLCGIYGVRYLYRGCSYLAFRMEQPLNNMLLRIWIMIYAVVGMQLGWRLRPFIGYQGMSFEFLRSDVDGNFYIAVWNALRSLLFGA